MLPQLGPQRLIYFDYLVWFDQNPYITQQLRFFLDEYGQKLLFFKQPKQAGDLFTAAMGHEKKFLVICSSRMIQKVDAVVKPYLNTFIKYIVFCGSPERCIEVESQYKQKVIKAFYHQDQLFEYVDKLDRTLARNRDQITVRMNWFLPGNQDRLAVRGTICEFARKMEYKWKIHMKILGRVQSTQIFQFPNDKQIIMVIDNRKNEWDRDYKSIEHARKTFKNTSQIFIIESINKRLENQTLDEQYLQFLQSNNVVESLSELEQKMVKIIQDTPLFD